MTNRNKSTNRNKTPLVVASVLVGAAIVAIASVLATRDGDDNEPVLADGETVETVEASPLPEELVGEVRPVTVEGSALPPFDDPTTDDPTTDAAIGLTAPVLVGENFDGSVVTTASEGGPVMVVFLAHWCPHCNEEIPRLLELEEAGRFPDDLKIVAVSTAVDAASPGFPPSEWIVDKGWLWPVMADDLDVANRSFIGAEAFGVTGFPFTTVIGADGTVLDRWSGGSAAADFIARLDAALAA